MCIRDSPWGAPGHVGAKFKHCISKHQSVIKKFPNMEFRKLIQSRRLGKRNFAPEYLASGYTVTGLGKEDRRVRIEGSCCTFG